jgi:hypothetical protein
MMVSNILFEVNYYIFVKPKRYMTLLSSWNSYGIMVKYYGATDTPSLGCAFPPLAPAQALIISA